MEKIWKYKPLFHEVVYFLSFSMIVTGLFFNKPIVSSGMIAISINWILEAGFHRKWKILTASKSVLFMVAFYLLHIAGMLWSTDYAYALNDVRIKLPLLSAPVVLSSMVPIRTSLRDTVLYIFLVSAFISSLISINIFLDHMDSPVFNYRQLSPVISHIRLSLMTGLAIFVSAYFANKFRKDLKRMLPFVLLAVWLTGVLFLLRSMSGIVAFGITFFTLTVHFLYVSRSRPKRLLGSVLLLVPLSGLVLVLVTIWSFYDVEEWPDDAFAARTEQGHRYTFDPDNRMVENGHYVYTYICEPELEEAWNSRSELDYQGKDLSGQPLKHTLFRYLASKGLKKDAAGMAALSDSDIRAIEKGVANERYLNPYNPANVVYSYVWEVDKYIKTGNPQGNSLTQRFMFWDIGMKIFRAHPVLGVGTGDVALSYENAYENMDFYVSPEFRLRAHNQFITVALTFGVLGLLIFLAALIAPWFEPSSRNNYLFMAHYVLAVVSMLNEDTLETQVGVTFVAFFFYWFLFAFEKRAD